MQVEFNGELQHHGIIGMKWGIRRYQNRDGTLTAAGRKRVAKMKDEYTQLTGKKLIRKPTPKTAKTSNSDKPKSIKDMSDTELKERINRLQMEKQAKGLEGDLSSKGSKFVSTVGSQVIKPAAIDAGKRLLTDLFLKVGKDKLGLNQEQTKDALSDLRKEVDELELNKRKAAAQDYFKKREQKEAANSSKSGDSNRSNDKKFEEAEFVNKREKKAKSNNKSEPNIFDADWYEVKEDSTALVPYRDSGASYIDELFKKRK